MLLFWRCRAELADLATAYRESSKFSYLRMDLFERLEAAGVCVKVMPAPQAVSKYAHQVDLVRSRHCLPGGWHIES